MPASVFERIADARAVLEGAGLTPADARLDAEVLARHALGWDRARLVTDGRDPMPVDAGARYTTAIDRRAAREPVAFITGSREFWGLEFEVSREVLIPRPESELIVEAVLARRAPGTMRTLIDVGTGSGCIGVVLARQYPDARVIATDISETALAVAAGNARRHGVAEQVTFVRSDLLDAVHGQADVIVSNPPYVPSTVGLAPEIVKYEPAIALYSGTDGLTLLERLIRDARTRVPSGGLLVVEFGLGQDDRVRALSQESGWQSAELLTDLQGIPRVAVMVG